MKKIAAVIICIVMAFTASILPVCIYAREGDCGYEGGISALQPVTGTSAAAGKTSFEYQELSFITGEPVLLKGTLQISKTLRQGVISATYTYSLQNADKGMTLSRTLVMDTKLTKKDNGQTIEETSFSKLPSESIKTGTSTYTLKSYNFTRTNVIDPKPAVNYFAGNTWSKKVYTTGTGTNISTVTLEITGNFYGYDHYWGNAEVEVFNYTVQSESRNGDKTDKWGGTASVTLSSTTTKLLKYVKNAPDEISFEGGFIQTQDSSTVAEYKTKLPVFDSNGVSTDKLEDKSGSLKVETFPSESRLPVPNLNHLRGHWAEEDVKELYSLEVLKGEDSGFEPEGYMTRGEFSSAVIQAAREVPPDPAFTTKTAAVAAAAAQGTRTGAAKQQTLAFVDVPVGSKYYNDLENAYKRGILVGRGESTFKPDDPINVADAITVFIRALGLENMASSPNAVTTFKDNDSIPAYARNAAYVAEKIGLVRGDDRGFLNPGEKLTKARAAAMLNRLIKYMREGILKDYRERVINY